MTDCTSCEKLDGDFLDCIAEIPDPDYPDTSQCEEMYGACDGEHPVCYGFAEIYHDNCVERLMETFMEKRDEEWEECEDIGSIADDCWFTCHGYEDF